MEALDMINEVVLLSRLRQGHEANAQHENIQLRIALVSYDPRYCTSRKLLRYSQSYPLRKIRFYNVDIFSYICACSRYTSDISK